MMGNAPDPILLKWSRRKKKAEALRLEKELKASDEPKMLPVELVRKAWRATETAWVQNLRTVCRQLGAYWGGKLGGEIEGQAVKLIQQMFEKMRADRMLRGDGVASPDGQTS